MPRQASKSAPAGGRPRAKKTTPAKSTTSTTTTTNEVVETATPVAPTPEAVPVQVETETTDETDSGLSVAFTEFMAHLQQVSSQMSSLKTEFRTLEKRFNRELRAAQKGAARRKRKAGARQPSGFVKPTLISTELASFLGREPGTEMARTEVTREINKYIRSHSLQDKDNGRKIIPDAPLRTLLKLKKSDELTYFNLQKYMSPHFAKASAAADTTA